MKKTIILAALFAASSASFAATTIEDTLWKTTYTDVDNQLTGASDSVAKAKIVNTINRDFTSNIQSVDNGIIHLTQGTSNGSNVVNEGNTGNANVKGDSTIIAGLSGAVGQGNKTTIDYSYTVKVDGLSDNQRMSVTTIKVEWVVFDNEGQYLCSQLSTTTPSAEFGVNFGVKFTGDVDVDLSEVGTIAGALTDTGSPVTYVSGEPGPMIATPRELYLNNGTTNFNFETDIQGLPEGQNYHNLYVGLKSVEFLGVIEEVPEPATASLGILGLGALMLRRRRR